MELNLSFESLPHVVGSCNHVLQRRQYLLPLAGLEAAVWVDPDVLSIARQDASVHEGFDLVSHELGSAHGNNTTQILMQPAFLLEQPNMIMLPACSSAKLSKAAPPTQ